MLPLVKLEWSKRYFQNLWFKTKFDYCAGSRPRLNAS
jgi:hypothetical protein